LLTRLTAARLRGFSNSTVPIFRVPPTWRLEVVANPVVAFEKDTVKGVVFPTSVTFSRPWAGSILISPRVMLWTETLPTTWRTLEAVVFTWRFDPTESSPVGPVLEIPTTDVRRVAFVMSRKPSGGPIGI